MYKTDVTYKNFLDVEVTETLRFNLTETELLDLVRTDPAFNVGLLTYIANERDYARMMDVIRKLIVVSYGEVSEDGKYFRKSDERALDFVQSAAYEAFRDQLLSDDDGQGFVNFMMAVFPAKFAAEMKKQGALTVNK
jgi:hypothetical protein